MIVDTSAIVAIVLREPGWQDLVGKLTADSLPAAGAPTLAETGIVLAARLGKDGRAALLHFLHESRLTIIPFAEEHWRVAVDTYTRFGKGRHAADLNFGDCLTYAVARLSGQPLLCTGGDFAKTDLPLA